MYYELTIALCQLRKSCLTSTNFQGTIYDTLGINHCSLFFPNQIYKWKTMRFRSRTEIKVAQVLEKRGLMYLPNSLMRLGRYHKSFEPDFLVCCPTAKGFKWAILEIDGYWHLPQKRAKEHERERLFEHSGVRVHRFDAELCENEPEAVVSELIELMTQ
ncbi:DUF559 domain-containing protein [Calothrix sp. NIES-2098]|uniref:DUF559 domain-containing protein n=1 Tax=Calothrix sp. NIES-2098 TaxID=1954171 RepID=UPI000B5F8CC4|nr:hypothetical protein NIES2098_31010 [Calothrix sp. NIES-2098]